MIPMQWAALEPHLDRLLDADAAQRERDLAALQSTDPDLARQLRQLLDQHGSAHAQGFLSTPVMPPPRDAVCPGLRLGAYTLTQELGQGGMGSAWLAQRSDGRFEGQAAIKLLSRGHLGQGSTGQAMAQRFQREGQILARLSHPHIAGLLDAGITADGQPYLVLEHVQGQRIDQYCAQHGLDVPARLRLFLSLPAAVAHAHRHLVVHRDIKPSNIMVTDDGRIWRRLGGAAHPAPKPAPCEFQLRRGRFQPFGTWAFGPLPTEPCQCTPVRRAADPGLAPADLVAGR